MVRRKLHLLVVSEFDISSLFFVTTRHESVFIGRRTMKRLLDTTLALVTICVFGPLMLIIALWIKVTSPGPVLYRGRRVGRHNEAFWILKFRSMVVNAERLGGSSTSNNDARITAIGKILRKYKLDELPQCFNVLRGEMSIVGPRPEVQEYVDLYTEEEEAILELRPGITDWASIWNSDEGAILAHAEDPDRTYLEVIRPTKLKLQLLYARNHRVWVDCKIIASTLLKLVKKNWLPSEIASYGFLEADVTSPPQRKAV